MTADTVSERHCSADGRIDERAIAGEMRRSKGRVL
jgi:hypothetical protein